MPVPKQKQSKGRTRKRRSHNALKVKQLVACSNCGQMKLNHLICDNCGYYKNQPIINMLGETKTKKENVKKEGK